MNGWRIGSLFAGIGGLELGLERAGLGKTSVQVECDPFALGVLARHWPDAKRYGDVREVGGSDLGMPEVLCGGFPCQDISQAGRGEGLGGARSGLWSEYARLIGEVRPEVAVMENVAILTRRGLDTVCADLAALGYGAEWDCIPAAAVGAPHQRDRIFIVAYPDDSRYLDGQTRIFPTEARFPAQRQPVAGGPLVAHAAGLGEPADPGGHREDGGRGVLLEGAGSGGDALDGCGCSREVPYTGRKRRGSTVEDLFPRESDPCGRSQPGRWQPEPDVGRVAHGVPRRVDRLRCLGNAVVPQVAEYVGRCIMNAMQTTLDAEQQGSERL